MKSFFCLPLLAMLVVPFHAAWSKIDPEDQKLTAEAAKQQLLAARSDYQQARADLVRYKDLVDKGFISAAEFDRRKTTYQTAAARLEQATAQLELNRNQTAYTTLHADQDGVVTAVQAEVQAPLTKQQAELAGVRTQLEAQVRRLTTKIPLPR